MSKARRKNYSTDYGIITHSSSSKKKKEKKKKKRCLLKPTINSYTIDLMYLKYHMNPKRKKRKKKKRCLLKPTINSYTIDLMYLQYHINWIQVIYNITLNNINPLYIFNFLTECVFWQIYHLVTFSPYSLHSFKSEINNYLIYKTYKF